MVPDLMQGPYYAWNWRPAWLSRWIAWESRRQKWPWMSKKVGVATQLLVLGLAVLVLFL
jgi:hypothetical protein